MANRWTGIGNLTRDPELRTTGTGKSVASFSIAVNRRFTDGVDYIPIVVWGASGENCQKYLKKGSKVAVSGALQIRSYQDKNGNNRSVAEIIADEVEFLNTRREEPKEELKQEDPDFGVLMGEGEDLPF